MGLFAQLSPQPPRLAGKASSRPARQLRVVAAAKGPNERASSGGTVDGLLFEAARKEPVAFLGGVFAGFLGLDMQQEPLKSWIQTTAAEAGLRYQATVERLDQERRDRAT